MPHFRLSVATMFCLVLTSAALAQTIPIAVTPQVIQPSNGKLPSTINLAVFATECSDTSGPDLRSQYSLMLANSGLRLSTQHASKCVITSTVSVDPNAPPGNHEVFLVDVNQAPVGHAPFAVLDNTAAPIPPGLSPQVDVMWEVMSQQNCSDAFGRRVALSLYCIQIKLGNNSGHALQIAGIGFSRQLDALTALGSPYVTIANSSYASTRAVLIHEQAVSVRNIAYNIIQGAGLIMAASSPFYSGVKALNSKNHFLTLSTIVNGPLQAAYNLIFPDPILKQITNLDDQSFRDNLVIANNSHIQTIVFVEKQALTQSLEEISIQLKNEARQQQKKLEKLKAADPDATEEETRLEEARADVTNQIATEIPATISNSNHQFSLTSTGTHSPLLVKLALGNLVIVGDEIEYLQRVQIQTNPSQGAAQSSLSTVPSSLTFADQVVTTTSNPQVITLTNTGSSALSSLVPQFTGTNKGDFKIQANSCSSNIAPAATCTLSITFTPAAAAVGAASGNSTESATLEISGGAGSSPVSVPLTATAVVPSNVVVWSTQPSASLSFGTQKIGSTNTAILTISNFQTSSLSGLNAPPSFGGTNPADFPPAAVTNGCSSATLPPGNNCGITITFAPQAGAAGPRNATMTITYSINGTAQPAQVISLSGVAQ
jgi:hypothetical protein